MATKFESFQTGKSKPTFMPICHDLYHSKAWQELTAYDITLYLHMYSKYQAKRVKKGKHKGELISSNKDNISVPAKEYRQLMHQNTFEKSIDNLIDKGFIRLIENRYHIRKCNIYGLSDDWQRYGEKGFFINPKYRRTLQQQLDEEYKLKG